MKLPRAAWTFLLTIVLAAVVTAAIAFPTFGNVLASAVLFCAAWGLIDLLFGSRVGSR